MSVATLAAVVRYAAAALFIVGSAAHVASGQTNQCSLDPLFAWDCSSLVFGLGSLVALALHRRWPALAGVRDLRRRRRSLGGRAPRGLVGVGGRRHAALDPDANVGYRLCPGDTGLGGTDRRLLPKPPPALA